MVLRNLRDIKCDIIQEVRGYGERESLYKDEERERGGKERETRSGRGYTMIEGWRDEV